MVVCKCGNIRSSQVERFPSNSRTIIRCEVASSTCICNLQALTRCWCSSSIESRLHSTVEEIKYGVIVVTITRTEIDTPICSNRY